MSDILILTGTALMAVSLVLALAALARTEPPRGAAIELMFIFSARSRLAKLAVNSPVSSMLATESFQPLEEKASSGGL